MSMTPEQLTELTDKVWDRAYSDALDHGIPIVSGPDVPGTPPKFVFLGQEFLILDRDTLRVLIFRAVNAASYLPGTPPELVPVVE